MNAHPEWLRPSMLPKLALCGHYRSDSVSGDAAQRGTALDEVFRAVIAGADMPGDLLAEDRDAVRWAVETAKALSGGYPLVSNEEALEIECLGLTGTADLLCEGGGWSADLKTGQIRNYREQQAAYALGFMDAYFADEWTVYLLFCDQEEVTTLRFTREEAEKTVRDVIAKARDAEQPPQVNDYCGWCAQRWQCPARREQLGNTPLQGPGSATLESMASNTLRDFCLRAKTVEEFAEKAREVLKERVVGGEKIPGVSLTSKRGSRKVLWRWIEMNWKQLGTQALGALIGNISESKLLPIVADKMPGVKIPDADIEEMPGSSFVRISQPKAK